MGKNTAIQPRTKGPAVEVGRIFALGEEQDSREDQLGKETKDKQ